MTPTWTRFLSLLLLLAHPSSGQTTAIPLADNGDSVCLSEILIATPQPYDPAQVADAQHKADSALAAIRQGSKFEDIAKKYSDGPSAAYSGALGTFRRGLLAKSIEDKVYAMNVGDVSDVIRTKQGFVILKVVECIVASRIRGLEIISDTQGIDFGPYLQRVMKTIKSKWYSEIPPAEETKTGEVTIEFAITTDGKLTNMHQVAGSGNPGLDRAAWRGISESSPFPRLPSDFTRPYLVLRFHFIYNPDKSKAD